LQGFELDGKVLDVKFAQRGADEAEAGKDAKAKEGKAKGTKVLVKNLPFEATKKDVKELFR
jgi:multiple RNA-binding domain-containing protein 1